MPYAKQLLPAFQTLVWVCFAIFLGIDLGAQDSDLLLSRSVKYASLIFCFAIALWHPATEAKDSILLRLAMALTLFADFCAAILNQAFLGAAILACVQLIYVSRHTQGMRSQRDEWKAGIAAAFIALPALGLSAPRLLGAGLPLAALVLAVPLTLFLYAGVGVFLRSYYSPRQKYRIAAGSILFFISVLLTAHAAVSQESLQSALATAAWVFYLPSQYLLAMSGRVDISHLYREKYPRAQIQRSFSVDADKVFDAWLDPKTARLWLFATEGGVMQKVTIDAREGGSYSIVERRGDTDVEHTGTYKKLERPCRLVFTLAVPQFAKTEDTIEVTIAEKRKSCDVTLVHHMQPGAGIHAEKAAEGWSNLLSRLGSILE